MVYEIGTAAIFALGLIGFYVSLNVRRWCVYGRATLAYFALAWVFYGGIRLAILAGMDRESAGEVNGLAMASIALTVTTIVFLHAAQHWMARKCRGECTR